MDLILKRMRIQPENFSAVDKAYIESVAAGAESVMEPATEPWGQRTCYIADPEGNLIEIGSFTKQEGITRSITAEMVKKLAINIYVHMAVR